MYIPSGAACAGEGTGFDSKPTCLSVKLKRKDGDVMVSFID